MRRDEACWLLTKIASNEIISSSISQRLYQIRDKIVCAPNPAFMNIDAGIDVDISCQFIELLSRNNLLCEDVQCDLLELNRCIASGHFKDCEEMVYRDRCLNCPCYKGEKR